VGVARYHTDFGRLLPVTAIETSREEDRRDVMWEVAAAYRFNRYLALELGFVELGTTTTAAHGVWRGAPHTTTLEIDTKGVELAGIATWPIGKWDLSIKLGVVALQADIAITDIYSSGVSSVAKQWASDDSEFLHGVAVGYRFTDRWAAKLTLMEYTNTQGYLSAGVGYRF
jgi:hypothetical protein